MDRFVRGDGWFVTQLVHFWEPPALCSRVSSRRVLPVAPGLREGLGAWEHLRPVPVSGQIPPWEMFLHFHMSTLFGF